MSNKEHTISVDPSFPNISRLAFASGEHANVILPASWWLIIALALVVFSDRVQKILGIRPREPSTEFVRTDMYVTVEIALTPESSPASRPADSFSRIATPNIAIEEQFKTTSPMDMNTAWPKTMARLDFSQKWRWWALQAIDRGQIDALIQWKWQREQYDRLVILQNHIQNWVLTISWPDNFYLKKRMAELMSKNNIPLRPSIKTPNDPPVTLNRSEIDSIIHWWSDTDAYKFLVVLESTVSQQTHNIDPETHAYLQDCIKKLWKKV